MFADMPFEVNTDTGESEPTVVRRQDDLSGSVTVALSLINAESWSTIRGAKLGKDLTRLSVEDARQELLLGVAQAWYAARMTGTLAALGEAQVEAAEHHLEVARAKTEAGTGLRLDQVRAQADLAQARQDLLDANLASETSRDMLGVLTGLGGMPLPAGETALQTPTEGDEQLVATALSSRTDLLVARSSVDLARSSLTTTRLKFTPTVSVAWQGSYQFTEPTDMGSDDRARWTLVAQLDIPIYDHFRYGELRERKAALRQAEIQLRDEEWNAGFEVRQARRDHDTAAAAVDIAGQQASLAAEALDLALAAY
jgi:outer membrane protein TolC